MTLPLTHHEWWRADRGFSPNIGADVDASDRIEDLPLLGAARTDLA